MSCSPVPVISDSTRNPGSHGCRIKPGMTGEFVIAGSKSGTTGEFVIAGLTRNPGRSNARKPVKSGMTGEFVIAGLTRNPGCSNAWMPDQVRHET
jgi:hypothetical protein